MGMVVKLILAGFWLVLVPAAAGIPFTGKKQSGFSETFLNGYLVLFTVMEILTLPMTVMKMPLHVLTAAWGGIGIVLAVFGLFAFGKRKASFLSAWKEKKRPSFYFCIAILLILLQIAVCSLMAHMDADDCFYVATATTDVYTDTIFEVDPYTGTAYRVLPRRYVLSPFPVFLAVVSQLSGRLHPAVMHIWYFRQFFFQWRTWCRLCWQKNGFPEKKRPRGSIFFWQLASAAFPAILFTMRETFRWFVSGREKLFWLPYFCRICFVCVYRFSSKKSRRYPGFHWCLPI